MLGKILCLFCCTFPVCQLQCFSGGATKADDAAELYVKAGNSFKMAKKWSGICA